MGKIKRAYARIFELKPHGFWPGFIIGIFYFSYIFWWLWSLYPLDTLGIIDNNFYAATALFFIFSISVLGMALFWGIFSFISLKILRKINSNNLLVILAIAGIFTILEYLRSWGFGIIWWGSSGLLGPHWTLGSPAYFLSSFKFILNTASIWGIYGIDFFVILFIVLVLKILRRYSGQNLIKLLVVATVFSLVSFYSNKVGNLPEQEATKITLIQTEKLTKTTYNSEELLYDFKNQLELLDKAARKGTIIVFPETSNFSKNISAFLTVDSVQSYFNKLSKDPIMILDNIRAAENNSLISKTVFINSKDGVVQYTDKKLLTPIGEYLPYIIKLPLLLNRPFIDNFSYSRGFSVGTHMESLNFQNKIARVAICSEILSPNMFNGTNYHFIIGQDSMGILGGNKNLESQILRALILRTVENHKPAVLASNYGRSYVINSGGIVEKSTDSTGYQILTADIVPNNDRTWYNKLGDLPILLLSLAVFGLSIKKTRNAE